MNIVSSALATLCFFIAGSQPTPDTPINAHFGQYVEKDLQAIRNAIKTRTTSTWLTKGYRETVLKSQHVQNIHDWINILSLYSAGFKDIQSPLCIVPQKSLKRTFSIPGMLLKKHGDAFFVAWKDPLCKHELPPLGSRLVKCNNISPQEVYQKNVLDFVQEERTDTGSLFFIRYGNSYQTPIEHALFEHNGKLYPCKLAWQEIKAESLASLLVKNVYKTRLSIDLEALFYPEKLRDIALETHELPSKIAVLAFLAQQA